MDESNHTPGPWRISESVHPQNACINIVAGEWGDDIASLYGPDRGVTQDESGVWGDHPIREANARLIAAAPELLAELRRDLAFVRDMKAALVAVKWTETVQYQQAAMRETGIIAALAKAEGK